MCKALEGELSCTGTGLVMKGNNFNDYLFASLGNKITKREKDFSEGSKFFPSRVDPAFERDTAITVV